MAKEETTDSDWSQIPADLLLFIAKSLNFYADYIRLRSVCHSWRSFLPPTPPHTLPPQLPWLLLPPPPPPATTFRCHLRPLHHHSSRRNFFNLLNGKVHSLHLPEAAYPRRICGSSGGWLFLVGDTPDIFCRNLLTGAKLSLSPLSSLPSVVSFSFANVGREYSIRDPASGVVYSLDLRQMRDVFITKVILSLRPDGCPMIAMAIVRCRLSGNTELVFCNCGDSYWKLLPVSDFSAEDVIYCEIDGLFYAVNKVGDVLVFDLTHGCYTSSMIIRTVNAIAGDLHYLVKSQGELLLVTRSLGAETDLVAYCEVYETVGFDVYRFRDAGEGRAIWYKLTNLGDRVVFVGENSSLALLASDFPGCKGNRIYFTDDHSKLNDVGFFDLGNGCIEPLPCYRHDVTLPFQWAPPVWISPNPC